MASEVGQGLTEAAEIATPPAETIRGIENYLGFSVLRASQLKQHFSADCKMLK